MAPSISCLLSLKPGNWLSGLYSGFTVCFSSQLVQVKSAGNSGKEKKVNITVGSSILLNADDDSQLISGH